MRTSAAKLSRIMAARRRRNGAACNLCRNVNNVAYSCRQSILKAAKYGATARQWPAQSAKAKYASVMKAEEMIFNHVSLKCNGNNGAGEAGEKAAKKRKWRRLSKRENETARHLRRKLIYGGVACNRKSGSKHRSGSVEENSGSSPYRKPASAKAKSMAKKSASKI